ncbi:tRNA (guanosine(46)-N7)-methyltransferase TrmB [Periweissella ghanensis]|uniref:tRNA (guanine-N(7)-)-methyltransferase n=1 Tax=Periweissella ghanensis TaxID=467997 RepID=A0ABM8ZB75_9LACO|nr:tRNA (guanosine(46)-N7)-methyltransferase TrmB [Periweissella ghanensis]MCM0600687.1 tRNA (guanosine(46)-N7)-methyltransferase TrmB [Periweissella ghanensis]CAH0418502.1 tRNA (guanine-N(7)-)-methyltransferase [Periweissella ghanensis]
MRLRRKPWAVKWLADQADLVITQAKAETLKNNWQSIFPKEQPIMIEVGTGKGQFIIGMAKKFPEINFIGMEIQEGAVAVAGRKAFEDADELPNLRFVYGDGAGVDTYFAKGEVAKVYLNFSDPWPKSGHEKRRLTYKAFLQSYENILPANGEVEFKTDNRGLFEYSLGSFANYGMTFDKVWLDMHNEDPANLAQNVETEYEQKFKVKGPIYKYLGHFTTK